MRSPTAERRLNTYFQIDLVRAEVDGYLTITAPDAPTARIWRQRCAGASRPYLAIRLFLARAQVILDAETAGRDLTPLEQARVRAIIMEQGAGDTCGPKGYSSHRLRRGTAETVAHHLSRIFAPGCLPAGGSGEADAA
jgi:hypothetical protein